MERAAQVALLGRAAHVVLLGQAVCPEPRETQAAKTAVRMFSPLAAQAKTRSTPRGQALDRGPIRALSINKIRSGAPIGSRSRAKRGRRRTGQALVTRDTHHQSVSAGVVGLITQVNK